MSLTNLSSVLGLLRLIKNTEGLGLDHSTLTYVQRWTAPESDEGVVLRVVAYIQSEVAGASAFIDQSDYVEEGKLGLQETISGLKQAFSLPGMNNAIKSYIPALGPALTNFALLVSIVGKGPDVSGSADLGDLINEVEELYNAVQTMGLDPVVFDTAKRHLFVLLTLLKNVEVLGVEAAMASYFELVIRLKTTSINASDDTKEKVDAFWPRVETWGKRIGALQKLYGAGASIAAFSKPLLTILKGE